MRAITVFIAIMIFAAGCATRTVVIKTHPADEAPQTIQNSKTIVADNHLEQGKHLYFKGKYDQATKHFVRSIANNRRNWEAYYYLGLTQQQQKRHDRAIGSFNNSIKYVPADVETRARVYYALGISWEEEGYLVNAKEKFKMALKFQPGYTQARVAIERVNNKALQAESRKKTRKDAKAF